MAVLLPDLAFAVDARGVPLCGRAAEYDALRCAGYDDLNAGRLFEGHIDALELIGRFGTPAQRERAQADAARGLLFGTWNTQDADGVQLVARSSGGFVLRGRKTFASGAGRVARGLTTAARPDGRSQLAVIALDTVTTTIDTAAWRPLGMEHSDSYAIAFDGVALEENDLVGAPGDYERWPWFLGGGIRFVAVQCGALERLRDETARYLRELGRERNPFQQTRLAKITVATAAARNWLAVAAPGWSAYDDEPATQRADELVMLADCARVAVERAAFEVTELVEQSVGARGLLEPYPFARLVRDLAMYIRQPAPDTALIRIAERAAAQAPVRS
ncbi:MAG: acyl-CoA dehydrogenase [Candidatus Eremiobacteraeota bacterium]|nr:acyl-CoA dehydrogenase [Candidatus Eremiobacteraeota bacterium]